jgi:thiosulfate dehydrogenase [quinone] large subunit
MRRWFARELAKPVAVLVPLRLFIGVGWLRAFFEKVGDDAWWNGRAVTDFLAQQQDQGLVVFPFYQRIIETVLRPGGRWVGWLVVILQLVIGIAILTAAYTNLALIVGASLNLSFMLAGRISPGVFYIAIQTLLFVTEAGTAFGVDGELDRRSSQARPPIALAARLPHRGSIAKDVSDVTILAVGAALFSLLGFVHASDFGPGGIDDPGLVLGAVMAMSAATLAVYAGGLFIREKWRQERTAADQSQLKGSEAPTV